MMIVQPTPAGPRGPLRRAARMAGLAIPVLLLAAAVGTGLLGPKPAPAPPEPSVPPGPLVSGPPGTPPAGVVAPPAVDRVAGFPAVMADLRVLSVLAARSELAASGERPLAVAGYLIQVRPPETCPAADGDTRGVMSPLCERNARLIASIDDPAAPGAHLHVRIPPGVRLPGYLEDAEPDGPVPVVLIGRADGGDAPCSATTRGCHDRFVADSVAWSDGSPFYPGPIFDAGLVVIPPAIALRRLSEATTLATGWSGTVLVAALVRPRTVAAIDPVAAAEMTAGPAPGGLVWYVRGLDTAYDATHYALEKSPPRLSWAVVDEATGLTVARGIASGEDGFPSTVAGLPVRGVESALEARRRGLAPRVVAIAGWLRAWADPRACTDPIAGLPGGGCVRLAMLVGQPWADPPTGTSADVGPLLYAVVPPGVLVPDRAVGLSVPGLGPPPPVVVIGRFGATDEGCARDLRGCREPFTIEAVVWTSGQRLLAGRRVATGLVADGDPVAASIADPASGPLRGATTVLRAVLAPAAALGALDSAAAAALPRTPPATPVWYVRGLAGGDGAAIEWVVVEPGTGIVLARGEAG